MAMAGDGRFVVTWQSDVQDGHGYGVFAQRYDADGNSVGTEFQVNSYTTSAQVSSSVAMAGDGRFVVTWQSHGQVGDGYGIFGKLSLADGSPRGPGSW